MVPRVLRGPLASRIVSGLVETVAAAAVGVAVAGLVLYLYGAPVGAGLRLLLASAWSDPGYLLGKASPLVLTGLAFALPLYAGLFNIAGEGMAYLGALSALVASRLAPWLGPLPGLAAGAAAGALLGLLVGWLRVSLQVNEVVSSVMLNWALYYLSIYAIVVWLADPLFPTQSLPVPPGARVPRSPVDLLFILSIAAAAAGHLLLHRSRLGFSLRVTGYSEKTSLYAGFNPGRARLLGMVAAGVFGGLAGSLVVQGLPPYSIDVTLSVLYGVGFTGISVSLLARNQPLAMPLSALFIASLVIGGQFMEESLGTPPELADLATGVIVVALAAPEAYRMLAARLRGGRRG